MGNLISGNTERGVAIMGTRTHGCVIQGNTIGANRSGTAVIGNGQDGVLIYQAHDNLIGGSLPGQGNIIAGNGGDGLQFAVASATGNVVQGNAIGTNFTGALNLGNAGSGVYAWANNLLIGGTSAGEGNTIAYNGRSGVMVALASAVAIRGNSIHDNLGPGIELYGAGNGQNAPVLTTTSFGAPTYVAGQLTTSGSSNSGFTLEFYASAATDDAGLGEGDRFLGALTIITDGAGKADFSGVLPTATASGEFITAIAIDAIGNTSGFSRRVVALTPAA